MLLIYGNYTYSFEIASLPAGATFMTNPSVLGNGHSGDGVRVQWPSGTLNTSSYVQFTIAVTSPYDSGTPPIGGCGLVNIQGLPAGTLCKFSADPSFATSISQRLVTDPFTGAANLWFIPTSVTNAGTIYFRIMNDVSGSPAILPLSQFAVGAFLAGRLVYLPTLMDSNVGVGLIDQTIQTRIGGRQLHAMMRDPAETQSAVLGPFTLADVQGRALSSIDAGSNPASKIDLITLSKLILTSEAIGVAVFEDARTAPFQYTAAGYRFNQQFLQSSMMFARPSSLSDDLLTKAPFLTFSAKFEQA